MIPDATRYGPQHPTDPPFLERCATINDWIRAVCALHRDLWGQTVSDLAEVTGIARPVLARWQRPDGPRPRDRSVVAFCNGLGLDPGPVLEHYGYIETADERRARKIRTAIAAFEEVLADPDLPWQERRDYEQQALSLLELALRQRTPPN